MSLGSNTSGGGGGGSSGGGSYGHHPHLSHHSHHHPHSHQMGIGIQSSMMAQTNNDMINTNVGGGVIDQFDPQSEQIRQVSFACFKNHLIIFFSCICTCLATTITETKIRSS